MFPPAALPGAVLLLAALAVAEQRVLGHPVSTGSLYNSAALQGHCITHLTECRGGTVRYPQPWPGHGGHWPATSGAGARQQAADYSRIYPDWASRYKPANFNLFVRTIKLMQESM